MLEEFPQDKIIDHDAVVASYSPEMLTARDELIGIVENLREQLSIADTSGQLPSRTGYHVYEDGTTAFDLGRYSTDPFEALSQFRTEKEFASLTGSPDINEDLTVVTIRNNKKPEIPDPDMPLIEEPMVKIESSRKADDVTILAILSIYADGYMEVGSEFVRTELTHPPDASEHTRTFAEPTVKKEVHIAPATLRPAELSDLENVTAHLMNAASKIGL